MSGYSGGGKKLIAAYEDENREDKFSSARMYAWGQSHKHLKEMKQIVGLAAEPLFCPMTTDYHSGMIVQVPLFTDRLAKKITPAELRDFFADYYKDEKFIRVLPFGADVEAGGARFDNLGKGASGAAIECMNIVLGTDEAKGLNL